MPPEQPRETQKEPKNQKAKPAIPTRKHAANEPADKKAAAAASESKPATGDKK